MQNFASLVRKSKKKRRSKLAIKKISLILTASFVFFLDRISKALIIARYSEGEGVRVWPGVFHLTRVNNSGAAFGILKHSELFLSLVSLSSILIITVYLFISTRRAFRPAHYAWALIVGGAAGNLFDRIYFGYVIDFLDFRIWPVFNLADTSICLGVFLLCTLFYFN